MVNSVYELATPPVLSEAWPSSAAPKKSSSLDELVGGRGETNTPKAGLPLTHTEVIDDSDTELNGTVDLEQSQSTQEPPYKLS